MDSLRSRPGRTRDTRVAMAPHTPESIAPGLRVSGLAVGINLLLAVGKIVTGVLWNVDAPEYTEVYQATMAKAQGRK